MAELFVNGRDTKVKSVTIKDDNGKCKVSLWRDLAASDIGIGQHVKISDVAVQTNNNEKYASSTSRTIIEIRECYHVFIKKISIIS